MWEPFPPLSLHPAMFTASLHHVQCLREIGHVGRYTRRAGGGNGMGWRGWREDESRYLVKELLTSLSSAVRSRQPCDHNRGGLQTYRVTARRVSRRNLTWCKPGVSTVSHSCDIIATSCLISSTRVRLLTQNNWQKHIFIIETQLNQGTFYWAWVMMEK